MLKMFPFIESILLMDNVTNLLNVHFFNRSVVLEELEELRGDRDFLSHNDCSSALFLLLLLQLDCFRHRLDWKRSCQLCLLH